MDLEPHALVAPLRGIYAIVNDGRSDPAALTRSILEGGARIVQYRAKHGFVPEHARAIRELTRAYGALFILNDDWQSVRTYDADGAHLGPDDASFEQLSKIRHLLAGRVLGLSCGTPEEAREAMRAAADYIGAGCVFATQSKDDAGEPIGLQGLARIVASTDLPVAAIGGITAANIRSVHESGAAMAAVISAIAASPDPFAATAALVDAWNR